MVVRFVAILLLLSPSVHAGMYIELPAIEGDFDWGSLPDPPAGWPSWRPLWPGMPGYSVPVISATSGVYGVGTWNGNDVNGTPQFLRIIVRFWMDGANVRVAVYASGEVELGGEVLIWTGLAQGKEGTVTGHVLLHDRDAADVQRAPYIRAWVQNNLETVALDGDGQVVGGTLSGSQFSGQDETFSAAVASRLPSMPSISAVELPTVHFFLHKPSGLLSNPIGTDTFSGISLSINEGMMNDNSGEAGEHWATIAQLRTVVRTFLLVVVSWYFLGAMLRVVRQY